MPTQNYLSTMIGVGSSRALANFGKTLVSKKLVLDDISLDALTLAVQDGTCARGACSVVIPIDRGGGTEVASSVHGSVQPGLLRTRNLDHMGGPMELFSHGFGGRSGIGSMS